LRLVIAHTGVSFANPQQAQTASISQLVAEGFPRDHFSVPEHHTDNRQGIRHHGGRADPHDDPDPDQELNKEPGQHREIRREVR
jgi:hypothetical protein